MFGYVRPLTGELRVRELEDYKAVYCGLCHSLGKNCGLLARLTLNYDFVFLAMVLAPGARPCTVERRFCPLHPFSRRRVCRQMEGLDVAAQEGVILSYQKLRDDVADKSFFCALPARLAARCLRPAYRRAAKARPEFDRQVTACLEQLYRLEEENCPSIDRPADAFARLLQAAAPETGSPGRDRALAQLLYHVGRWIYLIDAWDDLPQDIKKGNYNPLNLRFEGKAEEHMQDVQVTLLHSRNLAASAYELAKAEHWDGILSNILYLGLPAVEQAVLSRQWRKRRWYQ
ncbi:MAG: DUF5685 family protein [Oscillospiraceae bacterium]|nr:DUF5685 family protein [Oscillospiraceae bacterium]